MTTQTQVLDLQQLAQFDPTGGRGNGANLRSCCPLCGTDKPRDAAHRSLVYRNDNGVWNCKRCGETGKLRGFWQERPVVARDGDWRNARARRTRAAFSQLRTLEDDAALPDSANWRAHLRGLEPLAGTVGADYLAGRGIPLDVATLAGTRFQSDWFGLPSVVFPIRNGAGKLVAAQGRRIAVSNGPSALTCGPKSRGVFLAPARVDDSVFHPLDCNAPGVIFCEAPIDALSLAACGFPALALCGINAEATTLPSWMRFACALRPFWAAFDADPAGESATQALASQMDAVGARCHVLRPEGTKDWNEALQLIGREALTDWLAARVLGNVSIL